MRLRGAVALASVWTALVAGAATGCTSAPDEPAGGGRPDQPPVTPVTGLPDHDVTVLAGPAPELAIGTSRALYRRAPVVLLAGADDLASQAAAAPVAVGLGVPLLLTGAPPDDAGPASPGPASPGPVSPGPARPEQAAALAAELTRLEPAAVLAVGDASGRWARQWGRLPVVPVPADPAVLAGRTGVPLGAAPPVSPAELAAAVAALQPEQPVRLDLPAPAPTPPVPGPSGREPGRPPPVRGLGAAPTARPPAGAVLPRVARPEPLRSLTVLAPDAAHPVAAIATARAAGARVLVTRASDPRADPDLIAALADQPPSHTLALGDRFGPADRLRGRQAVAATGVQLPGGGQLVFPGRRFVALYGHPGEPVLGVLGEQPLEQTLARADRVAADYRPLVDEPVVPALEIITTVASASPGPDGDYSRPTPLASLRPWVDAARTAGAYVVLDLQPGRTDFLTQARRYEELLREPHVGLALDPEWRLKPGQRHLEQIGSVEAAEVNRVVDWLADLTARHQLPQKLLVLHQFTLHMVTDREQLDTGRDELAVLIHVDGFGTPAQKLNTWNALHHRQPPGVFWGWKNFYDEDRPTLTPARTVAVSPSPRFISYQ
jgi:hypothetical protein